MVALTRRAPLIARILATSSQLEALSPEWDSLMARSDTGDEPMRSPAWVGAWWRCFGEGRRLRLVTFRQGPRLVGVVPLCLRTAWAAPGVPMRRLDLVPSGEPEAEEIASEYIGPVIESGLEQMVVDRLAELLAADAVGRWDELVMPAMSLHGPVVPILSGAFERLGSVNQELTGGAPYIPLPADWEEYLARLSPSHRSLVRRSLRAFDRWTGGHAELRVARTARELEVGAAALRELHAARWQQAGHPGLFAAPRFREFHDRVMPELLARGALELMWLRAHGRPVAALYNLVWRDKVYFYQSGRRPGLPRDVRAGVVIHALAIRRAIEQGRREYDFLAGASRYKQELALATRPIGRLRVVRRGAAARVRRVYLRCAAVGRALRASRR
jgi:CelD/BcsL family acetyltransferase involved in cellulose biosynthesis